MKGFQISCEFVQILPGIEMDFDGFYYATYGRAKYGPYSCATVAAKCRANLLKARDDFKRETATERFARQPVRRR